VAVKILFAGAVDEDGDPVDPNADEEFHKECAVLQRVDNPHLLKFFGFGTTKEGKGFIVTELMLGGSLEDVLHDPEYDLPWSTRVTVGLHVALGVEHLHNLHMLHRDLKSANVLLDEHLTTAKVCDFGLTRVVRSARQHVVHSPFTGVTRLLPQAVAIHSDGQSALSSIAVSFVDARGTMTKAAGTLLWMAPEVFRGDRHYTRAVDVYSFGIVMWELATRKVPWEEELPSDPALFFEEMNRALQKGRRPVIPQHVSAHDGAFVAVMRHCWSGDPANRPTFSEAAAELSVCLQSGT
jgi:serine/threonine protein kinase